MTTLKAAIIDGDTNTAVEFIQEYSITSLVREPVSYEIPLSLSVDIDPNAWIHYDPNLKTPDIQENIVIDNDAKTISGNLKAVTNGNALAIKIEEVDIERWARIIGDASSFTDIINHIQATFGDGPYTYVDSINHIFCLFNSGGEPFDNVKIWSNYWGDRQIVATYSTEDLVFPNS